MVSTVRLADIAERGGEIELASSGAEVVARHDRGAHPQLREHAAARVLPVEVAAEAEEGERELVVA